MNTSPTAPLDRGPTPGPRWRLTYTLRTTCKEESREFDAPTAEAAYDLLAGAMDMGDISRISHQQVPGKFFKTWKVRFRHRDTFSEAAHGVQADDVGWADMILTFNSAEKFEVAFTWLMGQGISQFTTDKH